MNTTCGWYITAPKDHVVKLRFTVPLGKFPYDIVQLYSVDGKDLRLINLARFYPNIVASSRVVYMVLKNNKKDGYIRRIFATYTAIKPGNIILVIVCMTATKPCWSERSVSLRYNFFYCLFQAVSTSSHIDVLFLVILHDASKSFHISASLNFTKV